MIQSNLIQGSFLAGVGKILFLGSSCIYPKESKQAIKEDYLLSGILEPTNEPYSIAKIAGIKLCESYNRQYDTDYRSIMPTNLYGPKDNFYSKNSHVIPALIRRFHEAKIMKKKSVEVWGSGNPMREFMHVDDMANAAIFIMDIDKEELNKETFPMISHINVGTGEDISIKFVAEKIKEIVGFNGEITFNKDKSDGTRRKLLDISKLERLGWRSEISLDEGLRHTYEWFLNNSQLE